MTSNFFENHSNYNCRVTLDNDQQYHIYANWLSNNNLHEWKGWHCEAGMTRIHIDKNLQIWSGECRNDLIGDALTQWHLFVEPSICHKTTCSGCTDDLITAKWRFNEYSTSSK